MKKRWTIAVLGTASLLTWGGATVAHAENQEEPTLAALQQISSMYLNGESRLLDDLANSPNSATNGIAASVKFDDRSTVIYADPALGIEIDSARSEHSFSFSLPFSTVSKGSTDLGNGIVAFDNLNGSTTVPLMKDDGSVQLATIIESERAPKLFDYNLRLPYGAEAVLSGEGELILTGSDGGLLGGMSSAWAYDSKGIAVPAHYELNGNVLSLSIEHGSSYSYPIVAAPMSGGALLSFAGVSFYSGYYAVDAIATAWGRVFNGLASHASHVAELKYRLGSDSWRVDANSGTIREQFLCHVAGNYFEWGVYNMESNRPAVYWPNQLNPWDRCNP